MQQVQAKGMTRGKRLSGIVVLGMTAYFGYMGMENENALEFAKALVAPSFLYAASMFGADLLQWRGASEPWETGS